MQSTLALFGSAMSNFLTTILVLSPLWSLASQTINSGKIECTEFSAAQLGQTSTKLGTIIITLGTNKKASLIQFKRPRATAMHTINKTFSIASSTIKHEVETTGSEKVEVITASDSSGRQLVLKINNPQQSPASSFSYDEGKVSFSTLEEQTTVSCEGETVYNQVSDS